MRKARIMALLATLLLLCLPLFAVAEFSFSMTPSREVDGVTYHARPPADTTSILLIGYDQYNRGEDQALHGYSSGGQADFLLLIVLDHRADAVRLLQIDRDTMTKVRVTDAAGRQHDRSSLQICLAHAYGDTREKNNANTVLAVETLLGIEDRDDGAGIDYYIAMDISGVSRLTELLGGVTVTISDDLTALDPAMAPGATLTLNGKQAEIFCRARMGLDDPTNSARMARQRQFMSAAAERLKTLLKDDTAFAATLLDGMGVLYDRSADVSDNPFSFAGSTAGTPVVQSDGNWLMTSGTKQEITAALARAAEYTMRDAETLPGVHSIDATGYVRFDADDGAALGWALEVFYKK